MTDHIDSTFYPDLLENASADSVARTARSRLLAHLAGAADCARWALRAPDNDPDELHNAIRALENEVHVIARLEAQLSLAQQLADF